MYCICCKDKRKKVLSGVGNKSFFVCSKSQGGCGNEIDDERSTLVIIEKQIRPSDFVGIPYIEVTIQVSNTPTKETIRDGIKKGLPKWLS